MKNRWEASRLKKRDRQIIGYTCIELKAPKATGKRRLSLKIIRKPGRKAGDPDAYFKSLCDALKQAGMLVDDDHKGVELMPVRFERGTHFKWGTVITLEDIE